MENSSSPNHTMITDIKLYKTASAETAYYHDCIEYQITILNLSDTALTDVLVFDNLPYELTIMPCSIYINGVQYNGDYSKLKAGLPIKTIPTNLPVIIRYQTKLSTLPTTDTLENTATLLFQKQEITSNTNILKINIPAIQVTMTTNQSAYFLCVPIDYEITVTNTTNATVLETVLCINCSNEYCDWKIISIDADYFIESLSETKRKIVIWNLSANSTCTIRFVACVRKCPEPNLIFECTGCFGSTVHDRIIPACICLPY